MVKLRAIVEGFRSSLFFFPALFVLGGIVLAEWMIRVDTNIEPGGLPLILRSTVESARQMLATIAGATITVAAVVFSVTVVSVQLASSQFSPRILRGFFRDRIQQTVIGVVVGTFTYCLLVLRAVRAAAEEGGEPVIPNLSVAVGVFLAILSALAIMAFIDHTARSMQVGELIRRITEETTERIQKLPPLVRGEAVELPEPVPGAVPVLARKQGWVQQIDAEGLLEAAPPGAQVRLEIRVGVFVPTGVPLCTVAPAPEDLDGFAAEVRGHIQLGNARTMQQDIAFGVRQLIDIGLRALSPGINDPTTAYEVTVHLKSILLQLLRKSLPAKVEGGDEGRVLVRPAELTHGAYVRRAFEQMRVAGASQPAVAVSLVEALGMLRGALDGETTPEAMDALEEQARLVVDGVAASGVLPADLERVRRVALDAGFALGGIG